MTDENPTLQKLNKLLLVCNYANMLHVLADTVITIPANLMNISQNVNSKIMRRFHRIKRFHALISKQMG